MSKIGPIWLIYSEEILLFLSHFHIQFKMCPLSRPENLISSFNPSRIFNGNYGYTHSAQMHCKQRLQMSFKRSEFLDGIIYFVCVPFFAANAVFFWYAWHGEQIKDNFHNNEINAGEREENS
jgi:hypothetical protein